MKSKLFGALLALLLFAALFASVTFAVWSWSSTSGQSTNVTFTVTNSFSCSADGGGNITSATKRLAPTLCNDTDYAIQRTVRVNTTQNSGTTVYLDMWLDVNSIDQALSDSNYFKYALTTSASSCTTNVVSSGSFHGASAGSKYNLLSKDYPSTTTNDTFYLYIWLDYDETDPNTQGAGFDISLGGSCTDHRNTFTEMLAPSAQSGTSVNFAQTSFANGTNGLYLLESTVNDAHPVYYYRGNVTDNNVLFAGFCWKIVRTTSTGGTKLIYNGTPTGGKCNNTTGTITQLSSTSKFNNGYNLPVNFGYMRDDVIYTHGSGTGTGWKYAPDVSYDNGVYTLIDKGSYVVETKDTISGTNLNYHHYTCGNASDTSCATVRYVYYVVDGYAYYINLTNNKKVGNAIADMLTNSGNTNNSTIKTAIDNWYGANMTSYTNMLEDTIWCNDRSIYQLGGWNPDGGNPANSSASYLYFGPYERIAITHVPIVTCPSKNDSFTMTESSTGNGKLTYPVGLLTADEINMAGGLIGTGNPIYYLYTNQNYWVMSPSFFSGNVAFEYYVTTGGILNREYSNEIYGVRPSVSLKPSVMLSGGDGTGNNPYTVS